MPAIENGDPLDVAFGRNQLDAYAAACAGWKDASGRVLDLRSRTLPLKKQLDELEAAMLVNGGTADFPIDGANDTKRKAQLAVALAHDKWYQEGQRQLWEVEADLRSAEAEMQDAEHRMRGARLSLEWGTAWVQRVAAAEGRRDEKGITG